MSTLIKTITAAIPGSPATNGTPAVPSIPGTPSTPATAGVAAVPAVPAQAPYDYVQVSTRPAFRLVCLLRSGAGGGTLGDESGACVLYVQVPNGTVTTTTTVHVDAVPGSPGSPAIAPTSGTPGTPGVPGTPAVAGVAAVPSVPPNYNAGWTAAAQSVDSLTGNGQYRFQIPTAVVGVVTGFTARAVDVGYGDIQYGFIFSGSMAQPCEASVRLGSPVACTASDIWTITRVGTKVQYFKNNTLLYTSLVPSSGTLLVDSALFFGGDDILAATLNDYVAAAISDNGVGGPGSTGGTLGQLVGFASDSNTYIGGTLGQLVGSGRGGVVGVVGDIGQPVCVAGYYETPTYSTVYGELGQVVGTATGVQGTRGQVVGWAGQVAGFSRGLQGTNGSAYGTLAQPRGFSTNTDGAYCEGVVPADLQGYLFQNCNSVFGTLGGLTTLANTGNWITGYRGGYELFALGRWGTELPNDTLGFYGKLSGYSFSGLGEAYASLTSPKLTGGGTAHITYSGSVNKNLPKLRMVGSASWANQATMITRLSGFAGSVLATGGALARVTSPKTTFTASGTMSAYGGVNGALTAVTGAATGRADAIGQVHGTLPTLTVVQSGLLDVQLPVLRMFASGTFADVDDAYEGYSVTLLTDDSGADAPATTRLTDYPFENIVRFGSMYYGVGPDGVYELAGDTFDTDLIVAQLITGETDFGSAQMKRPVSLYMGGRMNADLDVTVHVAETEDDTYSYAADVSGGARNQRAMFGKGIAARYMSFEITNPGGEDFELDELAPEVHVMRRTA